MSEIYFHKIHDELIDGTLDTTLRKIVHTFAIPTAVFVT